jgi:hypothetical protein
VLTAGVTGFVTWQVSQNSAKVELAKVQAENSRLLAGHREDERRNRQATYHQYLDVANQFTQLLGREVGAADRAELVRDFNHLIAGVMLFGPGPVMAGAVEVGRVYNDVWTALEREESEYPEKSQEQQWRDASTPFIEEFGDKSGELLQLMHDDVTSGIADDASR